ncbi:MAG TPA: MMPL family transporter [Acidimicrobiales bacterium]|nr:MMPL family transporter [Acidimicrobiales bacterium]
MFARIGTWCHDRRWIVVALWVLFMVVANVASGAVGDDYRQSFSLPGADSTDGLNILKDEFGGQQAGQAGTIVFKAAQGVEEPAVKAAMTALFEHVRTIPEVSRVESPYEPGGQRFMSQGAAAGKIAYANVEFPEDVDFTKLPAIKDDIVEAMPKIDGLQIELGGFIFAAFEPPTTELIGLAFAIVILIVAFGSVLAMGLPVGVALFGIGIGGAFVVLFSRILEVPEFAPFIGIMIGLGVGIDYALLIVTRHREQLHMNHTVRDSVAIALDTAGRSVVFAGGTVVISLLGMLLMGIGFVRGLAVSASVTVLITVLASLTLLPAFLGFSGTNIEKTRWRGLVAAGLIAVGLVGLGLGAPIVMLVFALLAALTMAVGFFVPGLKKEVEHRPPKPRRETLAYRWSRGIQRRPWIAALASGGVLLLLSVPVLSLRLGFSDESNFAKETTTRKAYDLLVEGFGKGFNGQLLIVTKLADAANPQTLAAVKAAIAADPAVAFVSDAIPNNPLSPKAALWNAAPKTGPQDKETAQLVRRLRSDVLPSVEGQLGSELHVTGWTAGNTDASDLMGRRLPFFFMAVLGVSFIFLMTVFRSLLVPLKAVIMNMLSIGASYGVIVALFQWGHLGDITGLSPGPIESWAPMMLFAIVFGLSMDYEVFLLSRIREEWLHTGDSHDSVADGLASTAKVITAAAAIMVVVFGAFLLENDRTFKLMGTGLSVAVLLDATIVRMLLVPATMELLGDRNWWLPGWLDRLLPNIAVEGSVGAAAFDQEHEQAERERVLEPSAGA